MTPLRQAALLAAGVILITLGAPPAEAQWVWAPDTGWVNTRYVGEASAKELLKRARSQEAADKPGGAAKTLKQVADDYPETKQGKDALHKAAETQYSAGEKLEANALFERYLERYPKDARYDKIQGRRYLIGRALLRGEARGSTEQGETILRSIIEDHPFEEETRTPAEEITDDAMYVLGVYYLNQKRYDDAEDAFKALRKKFPKSEWGTAALARIGDSQKARSEGQPYDPTPLKTAKTAFEKVQRESPEGLEATRAAKEITQIQQTLAAKDLRTGEFYLRRGKRRAARVYFKRVMRKYKGSEAAARAAQLLELAK